MINNQLFIPINLIDPNPWQTRMREDPAHIDELAHSIRSDGLMQAPTGRAAGEERYQLAFGHSRLAAYKLLNTLGIEGYDLFPLNVREMTDEQMAISAFKENEKRRDLNPVEKATAMQRMVADFGWTQHQVAEKLHVDRSTVSNMIRMLRMPGEILTALEEGRLPVRSAMALMPFYEMTENEIQTLEIAFRGEVGEFVAIARAGEVNSDVIREKLNAWTTFLHPDAPQLEMPIVVEEETTPALEESTGIQTEESDDLETDQAGAQTTETPDEGEEFVEGEPVIEIEGIESSGRMPFAPTHLQTMRDDPAHLQTMRDDPAHLQTMRDDPAKPTPTSSQPKAVEPAPQPEPQTEPLPSETLFTITWTEGSGVYIALRKPGVSPAFKWRLGLSPEEVPALMREMGIE